MKEKLDAYRFARKRDQSSVHNQLERHAKTCGLDRGKAHGGKYNGKDARRVMDNPEVYYNGMRDILNNNRAPSVTEEFVNELCADIIKSMKAWNEFFSILQRKKPTQEERNGRAQDAAKTAVRLHVKVLNNKTPKVHVGKDHAVDQYLHFHPGFVRLITEHWVERSHQIGAKDEKNFRHVPNLDDRANQVAARRHQRNNGDIKKRIMEVHAAGKRGSYDKKRAQPDTPVAPQPNQNRRQRTDIEDQTPPTNNNNDESPQQAAQPANIQPTPPNNDTNQSPHQQPTPDQIEAPPVVTRNNRHRHGRQINRPARYDD